MTCATMAPGDPESNGPRFAAVQGFMGEVYASFVFISVLFGTVVDKRYALPVM